MTIPAGVDGSPPGAATITTFGCGAGVQSAALYLLMRDGRVERPDHVLFADTGNEPPAVYDTVEWLRDGFADMGVPFHVVSRFGERTDIAADVLDRRVYATIPAFTLLERVVRRPLAWRGCDCPWRTVFRTGGEKGVAALGCFAPGTTREQIAGHPQVHAGDEDCPLCWVEVHERERLGFDIDAVALLMCEELGLTQVPEPHRRCRSAGRIPTRFHTYTKVEKGRIKRACTGKYKIEPIQRRIRVLLGARQWEEPCRFCAETGRRIAPWDTAAGIGVCSVCMGSGVRHRVGTAPPGSRVRHMIGFSADEVLDRATTAGFPATTTPIYPLAEAGLTRADCEQLIRAAGREPVPSACVICPNRGNRRWRQMREHQPELWEQACRYDEQIRTMPGLRGQRFLHASMRPLRQAPIDKPSPAERAAAQGDALELLDWLENGPDDGCSPYATSCSHGDQVHPMVSGPRPGQLLLPLAARPERQRRPAARAPQRARSTRPATTTRRTRAPETDRR